MTFDETRNRIVALIETALHGKDLPVPVLTDDTHLLGTGLGIDSIDIAEIILELSDVCQTDPFADGFIPFRTIGELALLYAG